MIPMCDSSTGEVVGWSVAKVDCDGAAVTIEYYDTSGTLQGTTLPGGWTICRPNFASNSIVNIITLTQAEYDAIPVKDSNTLYIIVV